MSTAIPHETTSTDPVYWMGRESAETQRLIEQARLLDPFTRWIMQEAGISPGMSVLDIGAGAGNVSVILGQLAGPTGHVTGIDINPDILETARVQARAHQLENISFIAGDCRTMPFTEQFDAIVGRLVLLYVDDPAATLRSLASRLRPGGIMVFQEYNVHADSLASWPTLPLLEDARHWLEAAANQARLNARIGYDLRRIFIDAGLPEPSMQLDSAVGGGPGWPGYEYGANSIRSMLPLVLASGVATAEEIEIETLADRMRAATVASGGVIKLPDLISAWARVP